MLVPIRRDRTSKPPVGTPLRTDGHWSVQNLVGAWAFNEGAGKAPIELKSSAVPSVFGSGLSWSSDALRFPGTNGNYLGYAARSSFNVDPTYCSIIAGITWFGANSDSDATQRIFTGSILSNFNILNTAALESTRSTSGGYPSANSAAGSIQINKPFIAGVSFQAIGGQHKVFIDGLDVTTTTTVGYGTLTNVTGRAVYFGAEYANDYSYNLNGQIHFAYLYNVTLSAAQQNSLAANPYQIYEPEIVWVEVGGGEVTPIYLNAAITGSAALSAQLSTAIRLAANISGTGTVAGSLSTIISLSADIIGSAAVGANLHTAIRLAANLAGSAITTSQLATAIRLQAGISATSATAAALATSIRLSAAIAGQATTSASLFIDTLAELGAVIAGSSTVQANLTTAIRLAADLHGGSATTADITTILQLAAAIHGSTATAAQLTTTIRLQASITGQSALTAALTAATVALAHSLCISISARSAAIQITGRAASIEVTHDHC